MSFRFLRITFLLGMLALTLGFNWGEAHRVRSWLQPLEVVIYPINGDGSETSADYISHLQVEDFAEINTFVQRQAYQYGVTLRPALMLSLERPLHDAPPRPPHDRSVLKTIAWSLRLRWWVYRHGRSMLPELGRIRIYVVYHEAEEDKVLEHSLGLQKGLIGVVHAFASTQQQAENNVVIAHELMHTLGATDKYELTTNWPVYPEGYAEPDKQPILPQRKAEIMAGRIPVSRTLAIMPTSLEQCVIGPATAYEINFGGGAINQFEVTK
jgi:hypothetical protein